MISPELPELISRLKKAVGESDNNQVVISLSDATAILEHLEHIVYLQERSKNYLIKKTIFEETFFKTGESVTGAALESVGFNIDDLIKEGYIKVYEK